MSYLLAGLLKGAGQGAIAVGKTLEERRREALETLRQLTLDDRKAQRDEERYRRDRADKVADDDKGFRRDLIKIGAQGKIREAEREDEQAARSEENQRDRDLRERLAKYEAAERKDLARLQSQLKMSENAADRQLARDMEAGEVVGRDYTEDGRLVLTFKNGRVATTATRVIPKAGGQQEDDLAAFDTGGRVGNDNNVPPPPPPKKPKVQIEKTITEADIRFTAKQEGITEAEARKRAKALGFKIVG